MSGSRWVTALLWLPRSKGHTFFCIVLLGILATSSQSLLLLLGPYLLLFLSFIVPILAWNVPSTASIFLKRSLVFPILLFSSMSLHWSNSNRSLLFFGTLHSGGYIFPLLLCLSPLFSATYKASSDNHFAFLHFFFLGWSWSLPPVPCHEPLSIVLQSLYQI